MIDSSADKFDALCRGRNARRRTSQMLLGYLQRNFLHHEKSDYRVDGDGVIDFADPEHDMLVSAYFENHRLTNFEAIDFETQKRALIYVGSRRRLEIAVGEMNEDFSYVTNLPEIRRPNFHGDLKKAQHMLRLLQKQGKKPD